LKNALWKQDYGVLFLKNFDVELLETGYLDERNGFDRLDKICVLAKKNENENKN